MENLNNLIWTDEISTCSTNPDPRPMVTLCLVAFCSVDSRDKGDVAPSGNGFGCGKDPAFSAAAAVCGL